MRWQQVKRRVVGWNEIWNLPCVTGKIVELLRESLFDSRTRLWLTFFLKFYNNFEKKKTSEIEMGETRQTNFGLDNFNNKAKMNFKMILSLKISQHASMPTKKITTSMWKSKIVSIFERFRLLIVVHDDNLISKCWSLKWDPSQRKLIQRIKYFAKKNTSSHIFTVKIFRSRGNQRI